METNNTSNARNIAIGVIGVALLLLIGFFVFKKHQPAITGNNTATTTGQSATTTTSNDGKITVNTGNGSYTIEQVPTTDAKPAPDLTRAPVTYPGAVIAPEARNDAETRIAATQQKLKADTMNWQLWVDLGIYQKQAGDYEGALLSWKYAAYIAPNDYVALGDIGNLYAYFIKDNAQAENYYKQAIGRSSTQAYLYVQLGEVYRDVFKDAAKAKAIADQGLAKIPNDPAILQFKATLN